MNVLGLDDDTNLVVSLIDGSTLNGHFLDATSSRILVRTTAGQRLGFNQSEVQRIERLRDDPVRNGTLIGLGIGFLAGFAAEGISHGEAYGFPDRYSFVAGGAFAAIGAAIGAITDKVIQTPEVIYQRK